MKEFIHWQELKLLEKAGEIYELKRQVPFVHGIERSPEEPRPSWLRGLRHCPAGALWPTTTTGTSASSSTQYSLPRMETFLPV